MAEPTIRRGNPVMKPIVDGEPMREPKVYSRNNINTLAIRRGEQYMVEKIRIDLTGWCNGYHRDQSFADSGVYPYMVEFFDSNKQMQAFMTDTQEAAGFQTLMNKVRKQLNAVVYGGTNVEVIVPKDCRMYFGTDMEADCGCRAFFNMDQLNKMGMKVMKFDVSDKGVIRSRLESVLDESIHQWVIGTPSFGLYRQAEFPHSIYRYREKDMSHADDQFREAASRLADMGGDYQLQ